MTLQKGNIYVPFMIKCHYLPYRGAISYHDDVAEKEMSVWNLMQTQHCKRFKDACRWNEKKNLNT